LHFCRPERLLLYLGLVRFETFETEAAATHKAKPETPRELVHFGGFGVYTAT
jgi:hypothetical protein